MKALRRVVINLPARTDRRAEMKSQLASVGWEAEFFPAIRPAHKGDFPSIGARGCFESHLGVLKYAIGSNLLLIEDDLNFAADFRSRWQGAVDAVPDDWSIVYPAHEVEEGLVAPGTGIMRTHMMLFRESIIPRVIQELETIMSRPGGHPLGGPMHVDGAYSTIRRQNPEIKTYAISPPLGYQRSSRTDVGSLHWVDTYPVLARAARKAKSAALRLFID